MYKLARISLCLLVSAPLYAQDAPPVITAAEVSAASQPKRERPAHWAQALDKQKNLHRVTPTFYRSAKLKRGDIAHLQEYGIKTVLSLRRFHDNEKVLKGSGIRMQRVPINTWAINDENIATALRTLREAEKEGPVLLHCLHGADRTGVVSAMYRMVYQGWSREQAIEELQQGGYGYHALWKNIISYLQEVDVEKMRATLGHTG